MKTVCAWCTREIEASADLPAENDSHGICRDCVDNITFQKGVDLYRFLDSLPVPVLVVDGEATVRGANDKAREMLGGAPPEIEGQTAGMVFECNYARLPGGCGKTVHCSACAIRSTIMETDATGKSMVRVPASLHGKGGDVRLLISTEKIGAWILLRIDAAP